ncbi:MAG TPA: hypothetical protein VNM89_09540 [Solirubrobacterales bacterium]|nr:hypothetical protein [Solirubrobacterales bacterium]
MFKRGIAPRVAPLRLAVGADGTVTRIDIESDEIVGDPIEVGNRPGAVAVGEDAVWVANNGDGTVTRIEP